MKVKKPKPPLKSRGSKLQFYYAVDDNGNQVTRVRSICKDKYGHEKGLYGKKGQLLV